MLVGLALAGLVLSPQAALAQGGERPIRWELPGFDISRDGGWRVKARRVGAERARLLSQRDFGRLNAAMRAGPSLSSHAITGTFYVPMVLFYYKDTPLADVRDTSEYSALLFGDTPPPGRPYTLKSYYRQLSNDLFTMEGQAIGWARLDSNEVTYTGTGCGGPSEPCNGIFSADAVRRMQRGLREALTKMDGGVDFGLFDNDGPDGFPNTADDDGWVDMVGFAHATQDGACGNNNHIWAHRYVLVNPAQQNLFQDYETNDARFGGGFVKIRDYFIQSAVGGPTACNVTQLMSIGTAAHEFGHALALPDLYDTQDGATTEGIGRWGLMGSGNSSSPDSPARMEAWSLNELGWVSIVPLDTSGTYTFGAAPTADTAYLVDVHGANPRGEYFLLENRQAVFADTATIRRGCQVWHQADITNCPGGLLIWHVDGAKVAASGWPFNSVNVGPIHGVKLEEADGERSLWCQTQAIPHGCSRGDAGDPYPGVVGRTAFRLATNPAAVKNADSSYVGFDIDQITQVTPGGAMSFRLTFDTTTYPPLVVQSATQRPARVMGASFADTLVATGGTGTHTWSLTGAGTPPPGVTLAASGVLSGRPRATGTFTFTTRVRSGVKSQLATYSMSVTAPALGLDKVLSRLFDPLAGTLSADQMLYLDYLGNNNGQFDVGDFKAWRDATGGP